MIKHLLSIFSIGMLSVVASQPADAAFTVYFDKITNNGNPDVSSQLYAVVNDEGLNGVSFTFYNTATVASSIVEIYFDDGTLLGPISATGITDSDGTLDGVDYDPLTGNGNNIPNLPGGNSYNFTATAGLAADSSNPQVARGVNALNEFVKLTIGLQTGLGYADTKAAMELSLTDRTHDLEGGLRIGLHVAGFLTPNITSLSDSYLSSSIVDGNTPPPLLGVPEPASMALWLTAAVAGAFYRRRRKAVC